MADGFEVDKAVGLVGRLVGYLLKLFVCGEKKKLLVCCKSGVSKQALVVFKTQLNIQMSPQQYKKRQVCLGS